MTTPIGQRLSDELLNDVFSGYDGPGGTSVVAADTTIPLTAEHIASSATYDLSAGEITVNEAGDYELTYACSLTVLTNARTQGQSWVEVDGSEVAGTRALQYCRQANHGATGGAQVYVALSPGDVVRIRARRTAGGGTLSAVANGSRLVLRRL